MNDYETREEELNRVKCAECDGTGECDDGDFGDVSYSIWKCEKCNGTGIHEGMKVVKVDAGIEFCECCHIFGNETLIQIELIQLGAPVQQNARKYIHLCDECISRANNLVSK